jgi:hypothetical protein
MLVPLALAGFLLIVMPALLYLSAYLAKRYTADRPIRLKSAARKASRTGSKPLYGEFDRKPGKPLYVERA